MDNFDKNTITKDGKDNRCKVCRKESAKIYNSRPGGREKRAEYRNNPDAVRKKKEYSRKPLVKAQRNKHTKERRLVDLKFRLATNLRARIKKAIIDQLGCKSAKTFELLGCSVEKVRKYLEELWDEPMDWNNYGRKGWEIDHIIPCASFDLIDPIQQRKCFHYTNLQPLWWFHNLEKSDTIVDIDNHATWFS